MTKLVILSDSHNNPDSIRAILKGEKTITAVIYLGDGMRDMEEVSAEHRGLRVYCVAGNCDFHAFEPREALVAFEKVVVFYTHGHLYGVKYALNTICAAAKVRKAHVALFGHTHDAVSEERDGVLLFNPGTCMRGMGTPTYGVITIEDGKVVSTEHKEVPQV